MKLGVWVVGEPDRWLRRAINWLAFVPVWLAYRLIWASAATGNNGARHVYRAMWEAGLDLPVLARATPPAEPRKGEE